MHVAPKANVDYGGCQETTMPIKKLRTLSALLVVLFVCAPLAAQNFVSGHEAIVDYESLSSWQFLSRTTTVSKPIVIQRDALRVTFDQGTIRLMQTVSNGASPGLVFEGSGTLRIDSPDPFELIQLKRFSKNDSLERFESQFSRAIIRTSSDTAAELGITASADAGLGRVDFVTDRHKTWLMHYRHDVDARVLNGILDPDNDYFLIEVETTDRGWVMAEYDPWRNEELTLSRLDDDFPEIWMSIDRQEDRLDDGRPNRSGLDPAARLENIDVVAELVRRGSSGAVGESHIFPVNGAFITELTLTSLQDGPECLSFDLHSRAKVLRVTDGNGRDLSFVRHHIGGSFRSIDSEIYDWDLLVVLDKPLAFGEEVKLRFEYDLEITNYALGSTWYPTIRETLGDLHTGKIEFIHKDDRKVRSMGTLEKTWKDQGLEHETWIIDRPAKMISFATGTRFREEKLKVDGVPEVLAFGPTLGMGSGSKIKNVAIDTANSTKYFQWLLDSPLDTEQIQVTGIASNHGQSFDGFIHLAEDTFSGEHPGASELFRAHEVAHQWFGHQVGWASYRDQWLSEAFAEYAAMMFVEATVKNGDKYFDEILMSYTNLLFGSLKGAMSKFARPWLVLTSQTEIDRMGPIGIGTRAGTRDIPIAYLVQAYHKGPLVIHMLRVMLKARTGNDELFIAILRDYIKTNKGRAATTDDFKASLVKHAPANWDWFFDQWIDRTEIPTLKWSWTATGPDSEGKYPLEIVVERGNVSEPFVIPVPIMVELPGKGMANIVMLVDEATETAVYPMPAKPTKVELAPVYSVLARVGKR